MAARALCKGNISFGLVNSIPIQVFIARQKVNHFDKREVSSEWGSD
jgi:non-homologous end joining protein Ku